jgi:uncharacterized membrane protein YhiD involved in acid resistance
MNPSDFVRTDLSPAQATLSILLAFALAFLWATVYRKTHSGVAYTRSFYFSLILVSPIVAMIMMAIGSNIALSLGLVGSLSVIRFRTVVKDTKDMAFLFMAIAIGLTAGANVWLVGIIGTLLIAIIMVVLSRLGHDGVGSSDYILIFRSNQKDPWENLPVEAKELISWRQLRGATDVDHGSEFEYTYSVRLARKAAPEKVIRAISTDGIRQVTMIAPENHLEL